MTCKTPTNHHILRKTSSIIIMLSFDHCSFEQLKMSNHSLQTAWGTDLPFSNKSVVSIIMHEQNIICSKILICRQLLASHVAGCCWPMKWKDLIHQMIIYNIFLWAWIGFESIAHEAEGPMGYWLRSHEGERNSYCFSKIHLPVVGKKILRQNILP